MPQPTGADLHVDSLLSDLSIAYLNEPSSYIADRVFPVIPVGKQSDKIAVYEKAAWFRDEAEKRAPLTESAGGGFGMETPATYFCNEYSWHQDISDDDIANADSVFDLEDDATSFVTEKLRLKRERLFASTYFAESVWATDLQGMTDAPGSNEFRVWDDTTNSTPLSDIEDAKILVRAAIGLLPNTLLVSERVHMALKQHPDVKDTYKYTQAGIITEQLLAKAFEVDNYYVAKAVYATTAEGQSTQTLAYALNQYGALLVYAAPRPSKRRPSGGYTIRWNRPRNNGIEGERLESTIRKFEMPLKGGMRIEGSVYEDLKLISNSCGVFFVNAVAAGRTITS